MKVYISVDMEGAAGVVDVDRTRRTGHDHELAIDFVDATCAHAATTLAGATLS